MSQVIELKDEVFMILKQNAEKDGITPEVWVEKKVKESSNGKKDSKEKGEAWNEFIGAVSEIFEPLEKRIRTAFGKGVARKLRKQGLELDYDAD